MWPERTGTGPQDARRLPVRQRRRDPSGVSGVPDCANGNLPKALTERIQQQIVSLHRQMQILREMQAKITAAPASLATTHQSLWTPRQLIIVDGIVSNGPDRVQLVPTQ